MRDTLAPYSIYDIALVVGLVFALLFVFADLADGQGFDSDVWYVLLGQFVGSLVAVYGAYGFIFKQEELSIAIERKK